jgi:hypothetical protein
MKKQKSIKFITIMQLDGNTKRNGVAKIDKT